MTKVNIEKPPYNIRNCKGEEFLRGDWFWADYGDNRTMFIRTDDSVVALSTSYSYPLCTKFVNCSSILGVSIKDLT